MKPACAFMKAELSHFVARCMLDVQARCCASEGARHSAVGERRPAYVLSTMPCPESLEVGATRSIGYFADLPFTIDRYMPAIVTLGLCPPLRILNASTL